MAKVYKLTPAIKDYLWGGNKLNNFGKTAPTKRLAESWELSFTKDGEATLPDGRPLSEVFGKSAFGTACRELDSFPVLTKFIDAKEKLSVQVHPSDEYALSNEGQYGKTEAWYVVDAEEGAGLYMGFRRECSKEEVLKAVKDGSIEELLSFEPVFRGDTFFIPAGTVHAIGRGVLIYEIQQNSTLTYRLYDYKRKDSDGRERELHIDKALDVAKLCEYSMPDEKDPSLIGKCKYFEARINKIENEALFDVNEDSFLALTCTSGFGRIEDEPISLGDTFFIPASSGKIRLVGNIEVISVKVN